MNEDIKKMIDESGMSRNKISALTGIHVNTLNNWYNGHREANTSLVELIIACSKNDEELLKNIKMIGANGMIEAILKEGSIFGENLDTFLDEMMEQVKECILELDNKEYSEMTEQEKIIDDIDTLNDLDNDIEKALKIWIFVMKDEYHHEHPIFDENGEQTSIEPRGFVKNIFNDDAVADLRKRILEIEF